MNTSESFEYLELFKESVREMASIRKEQDALAYREEHLAIEMGEYFEKLTTEEIEIAKSLLKKSGLDNSYHLR